MSEPRKSTRTPVDPALLVALTERHAPPPPGALANAFTFGWRTLLKIRHTPEQLFDVLITPIMFTLIFTWLFGGAIAGSPEAYLQFLLPGILVQTVMFTAIYTGFTLNTDISKGIFDRFRSMPVWRPSPIVGAMVGDSGRYTTAAVIVVVIGGLMGYRADGGFTGIVAAILLLNLFSFGIGWVFTAVALLVRTPGTVMTLSWLVLMPLTFFSNIYVDPATMPSWLQAFVSVNPISLMTTALRGIMDGGPDFGDIAIAMIAPLIVTVTCAPLVMRLYRRER